MHTTGQLVMLKIRVKTTGFIISLKLTSNICICIYTAVITWVCGEPEGGNDMAQSCMYYVNLISFPGHDKKLVINCYINQKIEKLSWLK